MSGMRDLSLHSTPRIAVRYRSVSYTPRPIPAPGLQVCIDGGLLVTILTTMRLST